MNRLDTFWEHSVGVITYIKLISLWGHTFQNDSVIDVGIYLL